MRHRRWVITRRAASAPESHRLPPDRTVAGWAGLVAAGWTPARVRAHLDACQWRRYGRAIVLHNGPLRLEETRAVALINCGPRAQLTSFTALHERGLRSWERHAVHVLVPAGARIVRASDFTLRVHWIGDWPADAAGRRLDTVASSLLRAAASFNQPRPACGVLAAGVQQRLIRPGDLRAAVADSPRIRHRAILLAAVDDIAQGAQALSEIDFARLCRRVALPEPVRQAVRREPSGRRRYLDAEWQRADGTRIVVEIDGALHLAARRWWDDQLRQNELSIAGDLVLRFPSAIVRTEPALVAEQIRRALR